MPPPARVVGLRAVGAVGVLLLVGGASAGTARGQVTGGHPAQVLGARPVPGPGVAVYVTGGCEVVEQARATPSGDPVVVVLRTRSSGDTCTDLGVISEIVLPLQEPLGDREVVDERGMSIVSG